MTLMRRLLAMFGYHRPPSPSTVDVALSKSRHARRRADEANEALQKYLHAERPFLAFSIDVYEHEQERSIYRGPPQ